MKFIKIKTSHKIAVFLSALLFFSFSEKHPFYMSVTEMKYSDKEKLIQTSVKLFTNDLEEALKKISKQPVDLINGKDKETLNKLLNEYLQKRLSLKINGELKKFSFVGFERESEAIWIYIEYPQTSAPKKVEIENTLLYDYIQGQINVVHFESNGKKQSSKVTNPEKNILFDF